VAVGRVFTSPRFYGGKLVKKKFMTMSFGCDHRIIDGACVARFSNEWKNLLENPDLSMTKMK
jgi:2-oxoisovalerate dehydrogenase E2 component (dihydrolipoyl transacylase)